MHDDGFSLIEVLVATTIMTVAIAALAQVLALGTALNASAGRTTFAAVLASQKGESLRALGWGALQRRIGRTGDYLDRGGGVAGGPEAASFTGRAVVGARAR